MLLSADLAIPVILLNALKDSLGYYHRSMPEIELNKHSLIHSFTHSLIQSVTLVRLGHFCEITQMIYSGWSKWLIVSLLVVCIACSEDQNSQSDGVLPKVVDFNYHVKPILSDRCFSCHGPDEKARKADLRLDVQQAAFAILDSAENRYAIVPGSLTKSHLVDRITSSDPDYMMPPPESNLALSEYEIELLKKWIEQGAEWKPHWSFIPPTKGELPKVKNKTWVHNEIDYFIAERLEQARIDPAGGESKEKLLRRLSFDLTGLPPTIEELDNFLVDDSPEAYQKQVDRLLASPAYGERMATIWLEAARYADSHGYQDDRPRTIWPWRDWVIDAFNENLSYKDFITWQLAGDLLPNPTYQQKLATAFNRNHAITQEGGVINEEYVTEYVADRTNTTGAAFMGLTMQCARCHDHKYDPISQKEYYQIFAFFNGIDERGQISYFDKAPVPNMKVEDAELEATINFLDSLRKQKELAFEQLKQESRSNFKKWVPEDYQKADLEKQLNQGLIAYFKLDEIADLTTPNEISGGYQGQANVKIISELQPPVLVAGKEGNALQFDGRNYVSIGEIGDFEESDRFSIGAWVKPAIYPKNKAGLLVRRNGEQRRGGYELVLDSGGYLQGALIHHHSQERLVVRSAQRIPKGRWSQVSMTYDGSGKASGVALYINGQRQKLRVLFDQLNGKSILNGNDFLVGNWTPRRAINKEYYGFDQGSIDEVRVYSRDLTDVEIRAIFANNVDLNLQDHEGSAEYYSKYFDPNRKEMQHELDSLRGIYLEIPYVMIMQEMDTPRTTHVLDRGVYDAPTEEVTVGTPEKYYGIFAIIS